MHSLQTTNYLLNIDTNYFIKDNYIEMKIEQEAMKNFFYFLDYVDKKICSNPNIVKPFFQDTNNLVKTIVLLSPTIIDLCIKKNENIKKFNQDFLKMLRGIYMGMVISCFIADSLNTSNFFNEDPNSKFLTNSASKFLGVMISGAITETLNYLFDHKNWTECLNTIKTISLPMAIKDVYKFNLKNSKIINENNKQIVDPISLGLYSTANNFVVNKERDLKSCVENFILNSITRSVSQNIIKKGVGFFYKNLTQYVNLTNKNLLTAFQVGTKIFVTKKLIKNKLESPIKKIIEKTTNSISKCFICKRRNTQKTEVL